MDADGARAVAEELPDRARQQLGFLDDAGDGTSATDPDTGASVSVKVVAASNGQATIEMPLTDSPRLLVLQDG